MAAAYVQSKANGTVNSPSNGKFQAAFDAPVGSGNLVVAFCGGAAAGGTQSCTDDKSNTYTMGTPAKIADNGNNEFLSAAYLANVTNAPQTVTFTLDGGAQSEGNGFIIIVEASGIQTSPDPLDKQNDATGQPTTPGTGSNAATTASVTPATDGQFCVACAMDSSAFRAATQYAAGTTVAWVERNEVGSGSNIDAQMETFVQATAAALAGTWTQANADSLLCKIFTFKAAAAVAGGHRLLRMGVK